ncbi:MAG: vWA domain-containing protein [Mycobacteriales bacterium]
MTDQVDPDPVAVLVGLARAAGLPAGPDRSQALLAAAVRLGPTTRRSLYWAGRLTLCASPDDLARYEQAFAACFGGSQLPLPAAPRWSAAQRLVARADPDRPPGAPQGPAARATAVGSSSQEVLRQRDLGSIPAADRAEVNRLLAACRLPAATRRSRHRAPASRGAIDPSRTVRRLLRHGGEPVRPAYRAATVRPRRVVLLVDVSGSMAVYADAFLRFAHAAVRTARRPVAVFTLGTRLTPVTRELAEPDPDTALAAVFAAVPDYRGGTRLGRLLQTFLDRYGQPGLARGAVVGMLSDGWERDDPALLGEQLARLHRLAHRVVWANPLKARPGYAPLAGGMAAALPHLDAFVDGHSIAALERLAAQLGEGDG